MFMVSSKRFHVEQTLCNDASCYVHQKDRGEDLCMQVLVKLSHTQAHTILGSTIIVCKYTITFLSFP